MCHWAWALLADTPAGRQTAGSEHWRGLSGARGGAAEGSPGAAGARVEWSVAGVLDDLPAPAELEEAGLGWMAVEFAWQHGRTVITTRAGEWVQDAEDWREVTEAERRLCDKCGQSSGAMRKCGQCRNVQYCSERARSKRGRSKSRCAWRGR